ncbi:MAG: hypothetical protein ABI551_25435 [Polyangiaceae bacterium]
MRASLFAIALAVSGLACHRSPPVGEAEPNVAPVVTDAGRAESPPSPYNGFASDAGPGFHLQLKEAYFWLDRHSDSGWSDSVSIDEDGALFAQVKTGCVDGNVGKAGVAKIVAAVDANSYFDPPNYFSGPTDSGSTHLRVRSAGRDKIMTFTGSLLEPIPPGTVIGTFTVVDGGVQVDSTPHEVDTTVPDLARRKQLAAILQVVHAVAALGTRPVTQCPADVYRRFDEL